MKGRVEPPSSPAREWDTLVVVSGEGVGDGVEPELAIDRALGPGEASDARVDDGTGVGGGVDEDRIALVNEWQQESVACRETFS